MAQVGIGTTSPDPSSILDISASDKGVLIPRMTTAERDAISNPANGLAVYNTDADKIQFNSNTPATPIWQELTTAPTSTTVGDSMKYSNTDTTTNVNVTPSIDLPVFGTQNWNDNTTLFSVSGHQVTITESGRYEVIVNTSLFSSSAARNAPEIRLEIDGTAVGTYGSTGYIRNSSGHQESSLHIREVLELTANQVLTVQIERAANSNTVNLRSAGSSNIYIRKVQ
eukprot:CAMPEP_0198312722 /NCGR_PEP_ID=MMETSP1450-20131203/3993_1 /TAXON_ID=753684 ORGANISM="Madagascaria erythrocladiodes, Strain CCMP3234" /NCGR_SAMPLE_ID=MMETSP1450 /ASSEMBLY_ACC=CAM_ASM_001115 /LENGTH=225 /DNA_ID=CAMNT_0044015679 /DNA_START=57 /DNA_END=734 /DNA_ORIENTATION=+